MCFSATGSFAASGLLALVGCAALARNESRSRRLFAAIPLIFAAQQAAEGIVWLALARTAPAAAQGLAVYVFLGIALVLWPLWLPLSLLAMEHDRLRRRMLAGFACGGAVVACYAATLLVRWHPEAQVAGHSIRYLYSTGGAAPPGFYLAAYALPTVAPFFFSSASLARLIGLALVASLAAAIVVERAALTSVWCFFAALLSGLVYVAARREQRRVAAPAAALHAAL